MDIGVDGYRTVSQLLPVRETLGVHYLEPQTDHVP